MEPAGCKVPPFFTKVIKSFNMGPSCSLYKIQSFRNSNECAVTHGQLQIIIRRSFVSLGNSQSVHSSWPFLLDYERWVNSFTFKLYVHFIWLLQTQVYMHVYNIHTHTCTHSLFGSYIFQKKFNSLMVFNLCMFEW